MRWVTFELDGVSWPGAIDHQEQIVDLRKALASTGYTGLLPNKLQEVCGAPDALRQVFRQAIERAPADARRPRDAVRLRAPLERPGKLICLAGKP